MKNKTTPQQELYRVGELYRTSNCYFGKEVYDCYANLVILEQPLGDQSRLEKIWEWEKE